MTGIVFTCGICGQGGASFLHEHCVNTAEITRLRAERDELAAKLRASEVMEERRNSVERLFLEQIIRADHAERERDDLATKLRERTEERDRTYCEFQAAWDAAVKANAVLREIEAQEPIAGAVLTRDGVSLVRHGKEHLYDGRRIYAAPVVFQAALPDVDELADIIAAENVRLVMNGTISSEPILGTLAHRVWVLIQRMRCAEAKALIEFRG